MPLIAKEHKWHQNCQTYDCKQQCSCLVRAQLCSLCPCFVCSLSVCSGMCARDALLLKKAECETQILVFLLPVSLLNGRGINSNNLSFLEAFEKIWSHYTGCIIHVSICNGTAHTILLTCLNICRIRTNELIVFPLKLIANLQSAYGNERRSYVKMHTSQCSPL